MHAQEVLPGSEYIVPDSGIKQIKLYESELEENFGELGEGEKVHTDLWEYSEDGLLLTYLNYSKSKYTGDTRQIEKKYTYENGLLQRIDSDEGYKITVTLFKYNKAWNCIEKSIYIEKFVGVEPGSLERRYIKYWEDGQLKKEETYNSDGELIQSDSYTYENGYQILNQYEEGEFFSGPHKFKYDKNGRIIEEIYTGGIDNTIKLSHIYMYDGDKLSNYSYSEEDTLYTFIEYSDHDDYGNWTKATKYENKFGQEKYPTYKFYREFEYWD